MRCKPRLGAALLVVALAGVPLWPGPAGAELVPDVPPASVVMVDVSGDRIRVSFPFEYNPPFVVWARDGVDIECCVVRGPSIEATAAGLARRFVIEDQPSGEHRYTMSTPGAEGGIASSATFSVDVGPGAQMGTPTVTVGGTPDAPYALLSWA